MMKLKWRQKAAVVLAAGLLLCNTVWYSAASPGEKRTALDAFNALLGEGSPEDPAVIDLEKYLDRIMMGTYDQVSNLQTQSNQDSQLLSALCRITNADLASYASRHALEMAEVRNRYYKALANLLRRTLLSDPSKEAQYENIQAILMLFLNEEMEDQEENDREKKAVRGLMSEDLRQEIASASGLPEGFVEFLLMNENWENTSWENDSEWKAEAQWYEDKEIPAGGIMIGSRDTDGLNMIARMQQKLIDLGYLQGKADGIFGGRTEAALLEFQSANGLKPTGICSGVDYSTLTAKDAVSRWDYGEAFWDRDDMDDDDGRYDDDDWDDDDDRYDDDDWDDDDGRYDDDGWDDGDDRYGDDDWDDDDERDDDSNDDDD